MIHIEYIPYYVYSSITYNRIPLGLLGNRELEDEKMIELTKPISTIDLLHWKVFNSNNLLSCMDNSHSVVDRVLEFRDTNRYTDDISIHLQDNDRYEIVIEEDTLFVIIYGAKIDKYELMDDILNRLIDHYGYSAVILSNILNCYIPIIAEKITCKE